MPLEIKQSSPQVSDSALRLPGEMPPLPADVLERFPSLGTWQDSQNRFWRSSQNAMQDFARAVLDVTEIAGVLVVDPGASSLYIKRGRGPGEFNDADTPFFVDRDGRFSLGTSVVWNPATAELVVTGTIIADAGVIGGWTISPTTLSKNDAVLDSAGQLALGTGNDIIILSATNATYRLWVGNATAGTATFSVTKTGALFSTAGTIGGFTIGTTSLSAGTGDTAVLVSTAIAGGFSIGDITNGPAARMVGVGLVYGFFAYNDTAQQVVELYVLDFGSKSGQLVLKNSAGTGTFSVNGDTGSVGLDAGAVILWGGDTNLYRVGANTLKTDDELFVAGQLTALGDFDLADDMTMQAGSVLTWAGDTNLYRSAANTLRTDDDFVANGFSGSGASLTGITATQVGLGNVPNVDATNASNISSGTLANARLPSAISVTSVTASGEIRGATARFGTFTGSADVLITGSVPITDDGGTTRKLAVVA